MYVRRFLFGFLAFIAAITLIGIVISGFAALHDLISWGYALYEASELRAWQVFAACILLMFSILSAVAYMEKRWGPL